MKSIVREGKTWMYVILAYDVNEKRVAKVLKIARKYLTWVQNSLLEGELTMSQFERLKSELLRIIKEDEDSLMFYKLSCEKVFQREQYGERCGPEFMI